MAIVGMALVCSGCNSAREPQVVAAAPAPAAAPVSAPAPVAAAAPSTDSFTASGPVVVENQIDVSALREGVVVSTLAEPGTSVHKGQLLAKLDDRQISADLDAAIARVHALEANLENWKAETKVLLADRGRAEKLYEAQVIPKEELEHAVYKEEADEFEIRRESENLNNARADQRSLELEKEKTTVVAPFDGVVARRYVRVGQKVAVGERLFWVTAMAPLEVRFTLPERYFGKLHAGGALVVTSSDISPEAKYNAKIMQVSPVVDPSSGTLEVMAQITDSNTALRPGMLVNVTMNSHP